LGANAAGATGFTAAAGDKNSNCGGRVVVFTGAGEVVLDKEMKFLQEPQMIRYAVVVDRQGERSDSWKVHVLRVTLMISPVCV
jgi:hypothetical protein